MRIFFCKFGTCFTSLLLHTVADSAKKGYTVVVAFLSSLHIKSSQRSAFPIAPSFFFLSFFFFLNGTYYIISTSAAAQKVRKACIHWTICLPERKDIIWPCSQGERTKKHNLPLSWAKLDFNKLFSFFTNKIMKIPKAFLCLYQRQSATDGKLSSLNFTAHSFLTSLRIWRILTQESYQ